MFLGLGWEAWLFMVVGGLVVIGFTQLNQQFSQMMRSGPGCLLIAVVVVAFAAVGYWIFFV